MLNSELSLAKAARRHGVSSAPVGHRRDRFVNADDDPPKYEHLYRAAIGDGNALAIEINRPAP